MRTLAAVLILAAVLRAADAPKPTAAELALQVQAWKLSAQATAAQASFVGSLSDAQKKMLQAREELGSRYEAVRKSLETLCAQQKQALDPEELACKTPEKK